MGTFFARSILRGNRTLADVPQTYFTATVTALEALCSPEKFAQIMSEYEAESA